MSRRWRSTSTLAALFCLAFGACSTVEPYDYSLYLEHPPRSILVLPPLDETPEVDACYGWLSTITVPLGEYGYYVFPVGLVDRILRENGLPTPGEMHQVSLSKLNEIFGADAVLYVTVHQWGTSYIVINSVTNVEVHARLVDSKTGAVLWEGIGKVSKGSDTQGGLAGMISSALVEQVMRSVVDPTRNVARQANAQLLSRPKRSLPLGPYHKGHDKSLADAQKSVSASAGN